MIFIEEGRWAWREGEEGTIPFEDILDDERKNEIKHTHPISTTSSDSSTSLLLMHILPKAH